MWAKALVILGITISLGHALCPMFECAQLGDNICAHKVNATNVAINESGCGDNHVCSIFYMMMWARQNTYDSRSHICLLDPRVNSIPRSPRNEPFACEERRSGKGFISGQKVVVCQSDADCGLQDGSYTQCQCAFRSDRMGLCKPDLSNELVFSGYWKDCGAENQIANFEKVLYWWMLKEMYAYLQTDFPCKGVFMEIQTLQEQEEKANAP